MKIIIDRYKVYQQAKNTLHITSELTYARSRKVLLSYFLTGNREFENIYVADHPYYEWYKDLPDFIEIVSPKSILSEKFPDASLPKDLSDEDVIQLNLIDAGIEPSEKEIIRHLLNIILPQKIDTIQLFSLAYKLAQTVLTHKKAFGQRFLALAWKIN